MSKLLKGSSATVCVLVFATIAMSVYELLPEMLKSVNPLVKSFIGAISGIVILLVGVYLSARIEGKVLREYGISWNMGEVKHLISGLEIGIVAFVFVVVPLYMMNVYHLTTASYSLPKIVGMPFQFIAVGFLEEYLCRGFIQHHLLRYGWFPALVVTDSIFSLMHLGNPGITPLALINIALAGTFIGSVMYAFNNIHAAVGVHITWNWVQGAIFGIPVSGTTPAGYFSTTIVSENLLLSGGSFGAEASLMCTGVTFMLTILFLIMARRNGNLDKFN